MTDVVDVPVPTEHEAFYATFIERNRGLISESWQQCLRETRFVVAGCGSTGGACVMPLVRSGAERFILLDPGRYELNNLNRQDAVLTDVGVNKAAATRDRILAVNPFADVQVFEDGVAAATIAERLAPEDVIVDAVDVTTDGGVHAKYALHAASCELRLKVLTAYDIAATQFVEMFDYEKVREPLGGRVSEPFTSERVLRALVPPRALPREIFAELLTRRSDARHGFPQLAMTSTLFGSIAVAYLIRAINGEPVRRRVRVDLYDETRPGGARLLERLRRDAALVGLWWRLR
jgi:tRNA threonylcarbamoyladenosine dehydratase